MTEQLTESKKEALKAKLISNIKGISSSIDMLDDELKLIKENFSDPIDQASAVEQRNAIFSQLSQKKSSLLQHQNALKNFSEDFGYCVKCGSDIEEKRLERNPSVTKCFDCQTMEEHQNKHRM